ncbi:MAG: alpha/beta hydrolase [Desulfurococcales archaeon]|nr:alpha/beta hydrolase [Desulfurococcales archaeon]
MRMNSSNYSNYLQHQLLDISKIRAPTLIIVGELEPKTALKQAKKMKKILRNSSIAIIPSAGHFSNIDNPKEFNKAIENFLKSIVLQ